MTIKKPPMRGWADAWRVGRGTKDKRSPARRLLPEFRELFAEEMEAHVPEIAPEAARIAYLLDYEERHGERFTPLAYRPHDLSKLTPEQKLAYANGDGYPAPTARRRK